MLRTDDGEVIEVTQHVQLNAPNSLLRHPLPVVPWWSAPSVLHDRITGDRECFVTRLSACASSLPLYRAQGTASTELQLCSSLVSQLSTRLFPVFFLYSLKATSRIDLNYEEDAGT
ncbi:hypothetical protein EI94DRAFT_1745928 [Lactarius quietus]|nr:hypothetical protein EI94DRAFT_1745928 [Lactarius quietus]